MIKSLKRSVWFVVFLLLFSRIAVADTDVFLPISQSKLSQEEIEAVMIDFFAERCNLPCESVEREYRESEDEYALRFGLFGYGSIGLAYDVTIRQIYGIPDDEAIAQQEAEQIAKGYASQLGVSERFAERRNCRVNYLVSDPEKPVWRILVERPKISLEEKRKYQGVDESIFKEYVVEIYAYTGEVACATVVGPDTPRYLWQY